MPSYVEVAVPLPVDRTFTYRVPEGKEAEALVGRRVTVPFGREGERRGFVVSLLGATDLAKVKEVRDFLDDGPVLSDDVLALCRFISRYYGCSLGEALDAALPSGVKHGRAPRTVAHIELAVSAEEARAAAEELPESRSRQGRILSLLAGEDEPVPLQHLLRRVQASRSPADTLARAGLVRIRRLPLPADPLNDPPAKRGEPPEPTGEQAKAVREIGAVVAEGAFAAFLLYGITGSGKTEVYLRAIADCVARGRQAIVLVPEISLTPQTARRFRERFDRVAVLHSAQAEAERRRYWKATRDGEVDVVVGPRSAVFAPVPRLGLLVVDEEHDTSFKQGRTPRYHARDVAVVRAREAGAAVVLGSATPSLESYQNARSGKYRLLRLTARVGGGALPPVEIVDMNRERAELRSHTWFSRRLRKIAGEALSRGEQTMLFLNRRGFAPLVLCRDCGEPLRCESCDLSLTWHRGRRRAACHLCGREWRLPEDCPFCGAPGLLRRGLGTERVEAELAEIFPTARVARMDSDTMTTRNSYERVLGEVRRGEVDVLVGTQMIAKGHHFPAVTAVGVLDADIALKLPDFRAAERTFQLIAQVAGRTGRDERGGRVVVQTRAPGQPALLAAAAHDYLAFAEEELRQRKAFGYPPFGRMLLVTVTGKRKAAVAERAAEVARSLAGALAATGARVLGPATPPLERVKERYRKHVVVKAADPRPVARAVRLLRGAARGATELTLDVDPVEVL